MWIELEAVWKHKQTQQQILVIWASKELVSYMTADSKTPTTVRKFVFLQDFEVSND